MRKKDMRPEHARLYTPVTTPTPVRRVTRVALFKKLGIKGKVS